MDSIQPPTCQRPGWTKFLLARASNIFNVQELKEQRAQVDLHMMLYLQEEGSGKEKNALFVASHEHIVELERSIGEYRKVEQASLRALHDASAARDRASMQQAIQVHD